MSLRKISDLPSVKWENFTDEELDHMLIEVSMFQYKDDDKRIGSFVSMNTTYADLKAKILEDLITQLKDDADLREQILGS